MAQWNPRPVETATVAGAGLVAAALAVIADPMGRLLFGVAAVGLLLVAAVDLVLRPRLSADATGLHVRTVGAWHDLPWPSIERIDVDEKTRYGLTSRTLEVETAGRLILLGRRTLGEDPRDVADALARIRFSVG